MRDGVRAAGTVEFGGLNLPPTRRRAQLLVKHFAEGFPELASVTNHEPWMGHRPCLPDSLPVIGESAWHQGLWFAFGHGHLGLTASAKTGKLVAEAMTGVVQGLRSEEHTSELQSLMRISYAVLCLQKKHKHNTHNNLTTAN